MSRFSTCEWLKFKIGRKPDEENYTENMIVDDFQVQLTKYCLLHYTIII